jgi:hypothetical protein
MHLLQLSYIVDNLWKVQRNAVPLKIFAATEQRSVVLLGRKGNKGNRKVNDAAPSLSLPSLTSLHGWGQNW